MAQRRENSSNQQRVPTQRRIHPRRFEIPARYASIDSFSLCRQTLRSQTEQRQLDCLL